MKKILFILSFLCTAFMINAQVLTVSGTVTDSTGTPIPNVTITLSSSSLGVALPVGMTLTDVNGVYTWTDTIGFLNSFPVGILDVEMTDCNGNHVTQSLNYSPNTLVLVADFTYCLGGSGGGGSGSCSVIGFSTPDSMNPMTFHFTASASGGTAPYMYVWDFGDGNISTAQSPIHTYTLNGSYNVCVIVTDANGCTSVDCQSIYAYTTSPCNTSFAGSVSTGMPYDYTFFTNNPTGNNTLYIWDFGDGNVDSISGGTVNHTYTQAGTYLVCLIEVNLTTGCVGSFCQPYTVVGGVSCQAAMTHTPDSTNPMINHFNVTASGGSAPYTYSWDFGDGNTSTVASPTHTYTQVGTYNACVTVTDANGCTVTDCQIIHVNNNVPCVTSFTSSSNPTNPNTYVFTSANAGNNNTFYLWDFGDGGIDSLGFGTTTYTYAQAGTYMVCLFEINMLTGCVATSCDTVIVGGGAACQAYITWNNNPGSLVVDFFGSTTTNNNPVTYAWDFGDGNVSTVQNPTHTYTTAATGPVTYNVTLTTTDASGCVAVATETVFIFGGTGNGQLMGYMWKDTMNFTPADGLVYLIEYDSTSGTLTAIDTVTTQQGFFDFQNVPMGLYLVKGALLPTDPDYANYMPTYFIQSLSWANGQYVSPTPFGLPALIDIQLVAGNNPGGAGFIGGLVVNGAGRPVTGDVTLIEDITNEEPMEGVSVLLLDANHNAVTHTTTAADGSYSFSNIAMGTYYVHVEEVGKVTFDAEVTVDADNMNHTNVHFTIHENMVTLTGAYAVTNVEGFQVFPNPVRNTANVQLELTQSMDLTMTVTNLMGQEFINQPLNLNAGDNSFQIEMSELPTGLYMVSLKSETGVITYRIQKL